MIGQERIKEVYGEYIKNGKMPRFTVIQGAPGSGKKEFARYISDLTGYELVVFTPSIESVRNVIELCYEQVKPIIYLIPECEKLSAQAENALLKVAEEPPRNAYLMLTVNDDSLLPTIKSRAFTINMQPYTKKELTEFSKNLTNQTNIAEKVNISETPGDLLLFDVCDYAKLNEFCDNIINKISKTNIASALKINKSIKIKESDDASLFDLNLFIKTLIAKYYDKCRNDAVEKFQYYYACYSAVVRAKIQMRKNCNKMFVLDELMLTLRGL